jgi:hypothetical protein
MLAAAAAASAQAPSPPPERRTALSGYMDFHFNKPEFADGRLDFHRFVLLLTHSFSDRIRFVGELEVEHAFVEGLEEAGELELEQAYIDFLLSRRFNVRAGMMLVALPTTRYPGLTRNLMFTPALAPLPTWPGLPPALYVAKQLSYAISAGSKNPDAAWQVLKNMAGSEGAQVLARSGTVPAYRDEAAKIAWFEQSPAPQRSSEFLFTLPYLPQGQGLSPAESQAVIALLEALFQVVEGKSTADGAYQQFMAARSRALGGK